MRSATASVSRSKRPNIGDVPKLREVEPHDYAVEWLVKRYRVSPHMAAALAPRPGSEGGRHDPTCPTRARPSPPAAAAPGGHSS